MAVAAAATQAEKDRLRELRVRFNSPADSPEWQFYAVLAPMLDAHDRADLSAQLDRIESRLKKKAPEATAGVSMRDLIAFTTALLTCVAVAVVSEGVSPPAPFISLIAAFVLGVAATLGYLWIAPMIRGVRR
jgi:hypothetical protein